MSVVSSDPIADMLSRIRNALAVNKQSISLPHSRAKESIAKLLKNNGYLVDVSVNDAAIGKTLSLQLSTDTSINPITELVRISKPGRRIYSNVDKMPTVKQGRGIVIVSTSRGIMTGDEAKRQRIGGELICKVY